MNKYPSGTPDEVPIPTPSATEASVEEGLPEAGLAGCASCEETPRQDAVSAGEAVAPIKEDGQSGEAPEGSTAPTVSIRSAARAFSLVGFALMTLLTVTTILQVVMQIIPPLLWPVVQNSDGTASYVWWYMLIYNLVPMYGFGLPAMYLVLRSLPKAPHNATYSVRMRDKTRMTIDKPPFSFGLFALCAVIGMGYMNIGGQIGNTVMSVLSFLMQYDYANGLVSLTDVLPMWATFILMVVIAPIGEEFIFRKLIIDRLRRYGDIPAILMSGLFFSLFHGNLYQLFYTFLLGCLAGYLYTRTGKLRWPILLHMFVNFMGGIVPLVLQSALSYDEISVFWQEVNTAMLEQLIAEDPAALAVIVGKLLLLLCYSGILYAIMAASVVLTIVLRRRVKLGQGEVVLPRGSRFGAVIGNAGVIIAVTSCLLIIGFSLLPIA